MNKIIQLLTVLSFVQLLGGLMGLYYNYFGEGYRPDYSWFSGYSLVVNVVFAAFFIYFAITTRQGTMKMKLKFLANMFGFGVIFTLGMAVLSTLI